MKKDDVWVMDADDSNRKNLNKTAPVNGYGVIEGDPAYSPDSTKIAFYMQTFCPRDTDLYTMNANGMGVKQITD